MSSWYYIESILHLSILDEIKTTLHFFFFPLQVFQRQQNNIASQQKLAVEAKLKPKL